MGHNRAGTPVVATCLAMLAVLLFAPSALAATITPCAANPSAEPVVELDGQATIVPRQSVRDSLRKSGVRIRLVGPANNFTGRAQYPVASVNYSSAAQRIKLGGAIVLEGKGRRQVRISGLQVKATRFGPTLVNARFAGKKRQFLRVRGGEYGRNIETGELTLTGGSARLGDGGAAAALTRRLGLAKGTLGIGSPWGSFDLYSLYRVSLPPKDPEGEAPPEPPALVRPGGATDIASATINWRVRDSFIRYVNSGDGASAIDGAVAGPAEGSPPLVYTFAFPFASGWTDAGSGEALVIGSGGVAFRYCRHTVNFQVNQPEIELNGSQSRMIFRVNGLDGTAYPDRRAVVVALDLNQADKSVSGKTTTWENIPGFIPEGSTGVFADFYFAGDSFGELDLTVTEP